MNHSRLVTQEALDAFVENDSRRAQEVLVELTYRLVCATDQNPKEPVHFPLDVSQRGLDGYLNASIATPYFPEGKSYWQFGTDADIKTKFEKDLKAFEKRIPENERSDKAAILVTMWSGTKKEKFLVKEKEKWLQSKRETGKWPLLRILDGTNLIDWVSSYPVVDRWLAQQLGKNLLPGLSTIEEHWKALEQLGHPPPMTPSLFTAGRDVAVQRLKHVLERSEPTTELRFDTREPEDVIDFISAVFYTYPLERLDHLRGRCLIVDNADAWKFASSSLQPHVLVATAKLVQQPEWKELLLTARSNRHTILYSSLPGAKPSNAAVTLNTPTARDVEEALKQIGHPSEFSRSLAKKATGSLAEVKDWLMNISTHPSWGQGTEGSDMMLAAIVGGFDSENGSDRAALEVFVGKSFGEWIRNLSALTTLPTSPLSHTNEVWRFTSRYRAWRVLAPRITNEDLKRFQTLATTVFQESHPEFELPREERHLANLQGKQRKYSSALREGLADSLALIGSEPGLLTGCSKGMPNQVAGAVVREVLSNSDWKAWASLNSVLPLLAEASPDAFLDAVERDLRDLSTSPFKTLYSEESTDILFGANHMTGLLWALETLAWSSDYLVRVTLILGSLDTIDPGGNWANRPFNSLTTIFLPWYPQTASSIEKRVAALFALTKDSPKTAWKVLLTLLPSGHASTSGSRKPAWRSFIPPAFADGASLKDYWEQVMHYSSLALSMAQSDSSRLVELVSNFEKLHPETREKALQVLSGEDVSRLSDSERTELWESSSALVSKHRKYSKAEWALPQAIVDRLSTIATSLRPQSATPYYKRLFSHDAYDLLEEHEDFRVTEQKIEGMRLNAAAELFERQGLEGVLSLIQDVPLPWHLGQSLGMIDRDSLDEVLMIARLGDDAEVMRQCIAGYVWGRFKKHSWSWVNQVWKRISDALGQVRFLMLLPFESATWERLDDLSEEQQSQYWKDVNANPYGTPSDMVIAAGKLLNHKRPRAASQCLWQALEKTQDVPIELIYQSLKESAGSEEGMGHFGQHALEELIQWLQKNPAVDKDVLLGIEWQYVKLLDHHRSLAPLTIERRMADNPEFFMEMIRLIFRSENEEAPQTPPDEKLKRAAENAFHILYNWRTPPGTLPEDGFSEDHLKSWIEKVRELASASGHLKVAMLEIGEAFARDPKQLWTKEDSIAATLNAKDADRMRAGFRTQLYNNRGVHGYSAGEAERTIAKDYKDKADRVETQGHHLLAQTLRELASSYESEAEREAAENPYDSH